MSTTGEECCVNCRYFTIGTVYIVRCAGIVEVAENIPACTCLPLQRLFMAGNGKVFPEMVKAPLKRNEPLPIHADLLAPICRYRFWMAREAVASVDSKAPVTTVNTQAQKKVADNE